QVEATIVYDGAPGHLPQVNVTGGLFTVPLDFGASGFDGNTRFLQVTVNGTPLVPRQRVFPAPYAIQTRGLFVDINKNVGIGTTTPAARLDIAQANNAPGLQVTAATGPAGFGAITGTTTASDGNNIVGIASNGTGAYGVWGFS